MEQMNPIVRVTETKHNKAQQNNVHVFFNICMLSTYKQHITQNEVSLVIIKCSTRHIPCSFTAQWVHSIDSNAKVDGYITKLTPKSHKRVCVRDIKHTLSTFTTR